MEIGGNGILVLGAADFEGWIAGKQSRGCLLSRFFKVRKALGDDCLLSSDHPD